MINSDSGAPSSKAAGATPPSGAPLASAARQFSKFVVYVDESGDHGLESVDPNYPLFVLAFCVFHKRHYIDDVVPALESFKFEKFGHDLVLLHETDIRKERGPFRFPDREAKNRFISDLTEIIEQKNFVLISCVIDKERLKDKSSNPYHLALGYCLETLFDLMVEKQQESLVTHVVVECRGKKEDRDLELEFRRVCDGMNRLEKQLPFQIVFADKRTNSTGLQLADLVARPVGLSVLRPDQPNRAFDVLKHKFFCSGGRRATGKGFKDWGLKIFPAPESEKPR